MQAPPADPNVFWNRLARGIDVAVAGGATEVLLGVREGFLRYFHDALGRRVAVGVVPQPDREDRAGLPLSDTETLEATRARAALLRDHLGGEYDFYVASSGGLHSVAIGDDERFFIRCWTVVLGRQGEAWGGSGSQQLPEELTQPGGEGRSARPLVVPGTRRRGGMLSSLTGRLENRRSAVALSTVHALSTLFYGMLERRDRR